MSQSENWPQYAASWLCSLSCDDNVHNQAIHISSPCAESRVISDGESGVTANVSGGEVCLTTQMSDSEAMRVQVGGWRAAAFQWRRSHH